MVDVVWSGWGREADMLFMMEKMEGQIEGTESMVGRIIVHDCTGDKPGGTAQSINDMCTMWVSMLWPVSPPLVESYNLTLAHSSAPRWILCGCFGPDYTTQLLQHQSLSSLGFWKLLGVVTWLFHKHCTCIVSIMIYFPAQLMFTVWYIWQVVWWLMLAGSRHSFGY